MENKDLFIVGGGINGAAIAADAAGRGLSVILCEKDDIAGATSSASTKLIHGGLRYLELYEFSLVRKALREREILMRKAPHLITPLQFILPYEKHLRPVWLMRLGLFIYDHLSRKTLLPNSNYITLQKTSFGDALGNEFLKGFSYYDCFTDDARLTLLNALAAKEKGAEILPRHEFISAQHTNNQWIINYKNNLSGKIMECSAKILINASGPWINYIQQKIDANKNISFELIKGSHIIVPKLYEGKHAYILQNKDERIVFAIPYQNQFTLIGTTDVPFSKDLNNKIEITSEEENYLCEVINGYFKKSITTKDILWSYAGVRCLKAEYEKKLSKVSRDYEILMEQKNQPPLITIIGGKLTTHRSLAEETVNLLKPFFPAIKLAWTATSPLPGGNFPNEDLNKFKVEFKKEYSWLPDEICERYIKNYGTRSYLILENTKNLHDMGEYFSNGLYEKELIYLIQHEWVMTLDDILWRRTKLGLLMDVVTKNKITSWLKAYLDNLSSPQQRGRLD